MSRFLLDPDGRPVYLPQRVREVPAHPDAGLPIGGEETGGEVGQNDAGDLGDMDKLGHDNPQLED